MAPEPSSSAFREALQAALGPEGVSVELAAVPGAAPCAVSFADTVLADSNTSRLEACFNVSHPITLALKLLIDGGQAGVPDLIRMLFDAALLGSGRTLREPARFVERLYRFMGDALQASRASVEPGALACSADKILSAEAAATDPDRNRIASADCAYSTEEAMLEPPAKRDHRGTPEGARSAVPNVDDDAEKENYRARDPRSERHKQQCRGQLSHKTGGSLNTTAGDEDPASTLVRPAMRIVVGSPGASCCPPLTSDDVFAVADFACGAGDLTLYRRIVAELCQAEASGVKGCRWASWKDGCHLISKGPEHSPTYCLLLQRIKSYFGIVDDAAYVRFLWYKDGADWKPLHHDTAAFSRKRAGKQNATIAVSLGGEREVVFRHEKDGTRLYLPQPNGSAYAFGNSINVHWKHGINALPVGRQESHIGRIAIIIWGWATTGVEDQEDAGGIPAPEAFQRPCIQYQRGKCTYGERCKFMHVDVEAPPEEAVDLR